MSLLFISREREYHLAVARRCAWFHGVSFFFFSISGPISREGRALGSGKCHCRFHRAIRNWLVTSNWRRRYSECTCGTMNSDPPRRLRRARRLRRRSRPEGGFEGRARPEGRRSYSEPSSPRHERDRVYHHAGTSVCKATRISCGDIDIATDEVPLRVTSSGAWQQWRIWEIGTGKWIRYGLTEFDAGSRAERRKIGKRLSGVFSKKATEIRFPYVVSQ